MSKEQIMNMYAINKGYENWNDLFIDNLESGNRILNTYFLEVNQLIQRQLIKNISDIFKEEASFTILGMYENQCKNLNKCITKTMLL